MSFGPAQSVDPASAAPEGVRTGARRIYRALLGEHGIGLGGIDEVTRSASRAFLAAALADAARIDSDLPADPRQLPDWLARSHQQTATAYRRYLDERHAGAPRRFFRNRSHALYFIKSVAPTKLVDGAWLYGVLPRWRDARLAPLIRIYLEELGDGTPEQHHVLLYRKLLAVHGADRWHDLGDEHHVQGAIQLSLAHHAAELLPEVVGFNLGYEQLPLHLPITAYELNELDVDPYYFSLHVTIDNASTGHARKALQCALDCLPRAGNADGFYGRMLAGFKLNHLGLGAADVIASFDLERELTAVLADKAVVGAPLHSDYCRIAGRTVGDWLATPGAMPEFLHALASAGWIRRGQPPSESRFWRLLNDDSAPMFGVFDDYEKQLISDWIADAPANDKGEHVNDTAAASQRANPNRFRRRGFARTTAASEEPSLAHAHAASVGQEIRRQLADLSATDLADDDVRSVADRLAGVDEVDVALDALLGFLSPANHSSPAGLLATRICSGLIGR
jgi:hypothetical protein